MSAIDSYKFYFHNYETSQQLLNNTQSHPFKKLLLLHELVHEPFVEVIPNGVVDKSLDVLRLLPTLVSEDDIVVPFPFDLPPPTCAILATRRG